MPDQAVFEQVHLGLKRILQAHADHLTVTADGPQGYSLDASYSEKFKRDMFFGSVQIKKNYVSFHLMPVYVHPELLAGISDKLKARMQGKSCFNFNKLDETAFAELAALTQKGFEAYQADGLTR